MFFQTSVISSKYFFVFNNKVVSHTEVTPSKLMLLTGVIIYNLGKNNIKRFTTLINIFLQILKDTRFIKLSKEK